MLAENDPKCDKRFINAELFDQNALAYAETLKALAIAMQDCEHHNAVRPIASLLAKILPDENQINFQAK